MRSSKSSTPGTTWASAGSVHPPSASIRAAALPTSTMTDDEDTRSPSKSTSMAGSRPYVVIRQLEPSSRTTQSTPLAPTHSSVVGPGTSTPQRNTATAGSPHAAVDWESVRRRSCPAISSGIATMACAHSGFVASGATSIPATTEVQPVRAIPATAASAAPRTKCVVFDIPITLKHSTTTPGQFSPPAPTCSKIRLTALRAPNVTAARRDTMVAGDVDLEGGPTRNEPL